MFGSVVGSVCDTVDLGLMIKFGKRPSGRQINIDRWLTAVEIAVYNGNCLIIFETFVLSLRSASAKPFLRLF